LKANRLSLNFDKIRSMQFTATNWPQIELNVSGCKELILKSYDTVSWITCVRQYSGFVNTYRRNYTQFKCRLLCGEIS